MKVLWRCLMYLAVVLTVLPGSVSVRADDAEGRNIFTHPHLHFTLKIPGNLRPSDMLEYLDPYAPSVDAAWLFPFSPVRITVGVFAGLGPFDLKTMANWPGRKRAITLAGDVPAFEQVSHIHKKFTIDIYVPHIASGNLVQISLRGIVPDKMRRAKMRAVEKFFANEIQVFRTIYGSIDLTVEPAPKMQ